MRHPMWPQWSGYEYDRTLQFFIFFLVAEQRESIRIDAVGTWRGGSQEKAHLGDSPSSSTGFPGGYFGLRLLVS